MIKYLAPEMEVLAVETEDIIMASSEVVEPENPTEPPNVDLPDDEL